MAAKRIILLLDGTWNDADLGASDTNIVRMREITAQNRIHSLMTWPNQRNIRCPSCMC
jgi:uncharacterized protein (DUF2235 family)